jgi:hypothetical protein
MSINSKMTAIASKIRSLLGISSTMGLDSMAQNLGAVQDEVDTQSAMLDLALNSILEKIAGSGGSAGGLLSGFSQYAAGNFTPGTDETQRIIAHTLSVTPNCWLVYADERSGSGYLSFAFSIKVPSSGGVGYRVAFYDTSTSRAFNMNEVDGTNITINISNVKLKGGVTYHWFAGVLSALS